MKRLTSQIANHGRHKSWREAVKSLKDGIRDMKADVITFNATISACEKGQQWITAVSLLREMQQGNVKTDVITFNATINACEKGQQWIAAVSLLREMQQ